MTITFKHSTDDDGLIDVTSVEMSNEAATIGLKRDDTDEVLIAAGTPIPSTGDPGIYQISFDEPASNLTYTYWLKWVFDGATYYREVTVDGSTVPADSVSWYYADQQSVEDLIGFANLRISSNLDANDEAIDTALLLRAGLWSDSQINLKLKKKFVVPLVNMDDDTEIELDDISTRLVVWRLNQQRVIQAFPDRTPMKIVEAAMNTHKKIADDKLTSIVTGLTMIEASRVGSSGGRIRVATLSQDNHRYAYGYVSCGYTC